MSVDNDWRDPIAELVEAVRFERQPIDGLDRLLELIIATDVLPAGPEAYLRWVRQAVNNAERLAALRPQPHTEGAVRRLLAALEKRLDEWLRKGSAATQLEFSEWRPGSAPLVAHLEREPAFLARWLGVSFENVPDQMGEVLVAVLRLSSGRVVALAQVAGNPAPGTSLLQAGSSSPAAVVEDFLGDTRLSRSVVGRTVAG